MSADGQRGDPGAVPQAGDPRRRSCVAPCCPAGSRPLERGAAAAQPLRTHGRGHEQAGARRARRRVWARGAVVVLTQQVHLPVVRTSTEAPAPQPTSPTLPCGPPGLAVGRATRAANVRASTSADRTAYGPGARSARRAPARPCCPAAREALLAALDAGWADPAPAARRGTHRPGGCSTAPARPSPPASASGRAEVSFLPGGPVALTAAVRAASGMRRAAAVGATRAPAPSSTPRSGARPGARPRGGRPRRCWPRSPWTGSGGSTLDAWTRAVGEPGTVVAALQSANGEVGTRQPLGRGARRLPGPRRAAASWTPRRRWAATRCRTAYDVLVGDARVVGRARRRRASSSCRERSRWRWPGAGERGRVRTHRRRARRCRRSLAAAEAWQADAADREPASARRGPGAGRPARRGRGAGPRHRGRRRPGRPAAPRGDVLVPVRRRRGAGRTSSTGAGFAVASGSACTAEHPRAQPRAGRDGRAHPRQRAGHAAAGRGGRAGRRAGRRAGVPARRCPRRSPRCATGSGTAAVSRAAAAGRAGETVVDRRAGPALPAAGHPAGPAAPRPADRARVLRCWPPTRRPRPDVAAWCRMRGHELRRRRPEPATAAPTRAYRSCGAAVG